MLEGARLSCSQCLTPAGSPLQSTLSIAGCAVVGNQNGRLACEVFAKDTPADIATKLPFPLAPTAEEDEDADNAGSPLDYTETTVGLPPGPYTQTCRECSLGKSGMLLSCAACQRNDGTVRFSVVETRLCKEFDNKDGTLFCSKPATGK